MAGGRLRRLWWGLVPLPTAFWGYFFFGGIGVGSALALVGGFAVSGRPEIRPIVYLLAAAVCWSYWFIAAVGAWRSAGVDPEASFLGRFAARAALTMLGLGVLFRLINGGARHFIELTMGNWK